MLNLGNFIANSALLSLYGGGIFFKIRLLLAGGARSRSAETAFAICPQVFLLCQGWADQPACTPPSGKMFQWALLHLNVGAGLTACVKSGGGGTPVTRGCQQADGDAAANYLILN